MGLAAHAYDFAVGFLLSDGSLEHVSVIVQEFEGLLGSSLPARMASFGVPGIINLLNVTSRPDLSPYNAVRTGRSG